MLRILYALSLYLFLQRSSYKGVRGVPEAACPPISYNRCRLNQRVEALSPAMGESTFKQQQSLGSKLSDGMWDSVPSEDNDSKVTADTLYKGECLWNTILHILPSHRADRRSMAC